MPTTSPVPVVSSPNSASVSCGTRVGIDAPAPARIAVAKALEAVAVALVACPVALALIATAGFAFGFRLGVWVLLPALFATIVAIRASQGDWHVRRTAAVMVSAHVLAGVIAASVPDGSWDGLSYQQEGVLRLASGWNPVYEDGGPYGMGDPIFNNHYPKASWIAGAVVLLTTGHIEAGKLFNLTLMVAAAAQAGALLLQLTTLPWAWVVILAGLGALNPVAIAQAGTFYVDGWLGSTLTLLVTALTMFIATGRRSALVPAVLAACLAANLKFTGVAYVIVLVAAAVPATLRWRGTSSTLHLVRTASAAGLVAVAAIGYTPYVRNVLEHRDPFYSAPRGDVAGVRAANLNSLNRVERFLVSNLSPSSSIRAPERTQMKFPLWIGRGELRAQYAADLEIGGFGPLYGAALMLGVLGVVLLVIRRRTRHTGAIAAVIVGALVVSMFVHGETWWARYVPQAWLVPLVVAGAALAVRHDTAARWIGVAIAATLVANVGIVAANVAWDELRYIRSNAATMQRLIEARAPVRVYLAAFPPLRRRLHEAGVTFQILEAPLAASAGRHDLPAPGHRAAWFD